MTEVEIVVAASDDDAIGYRNDLPWYVPEDLKHFRRLTVGHAVIAGRATHESIVARLGHPLPDRTTYVVSSTARPDANGVRWVTSVDDAIERAGTVEPVIVIGGASIYEQALPRVSTVHLTRVHGHFEADTFLPTGWLDGFELTGAEPLTSTTGISVTFETHRRI